MPCKPGRPCNYPGCASIIQGKGGYCTYHKENYEKAVKMKYEKRNPKGYFYNTARWRKLRNLYAAKHPLCEECLKKELLVSVKVVDHIVEIKDGGKELDQNNLQSLCSECHNRKTFSNERK